MDPLHPIVPVTPHLLPVLPTPVVGQVDRDAQRDPANGRRRQRRERPRPIEGGPETHGEPAPIEPAGALPPAGEDEGLSHVDVTA
jgi:hypothetical protein